MDHNTQGYKRTDGTHHARLLSIIGIIIILIAGYLLIRDCECLSKNNEASVYAHIEAEHTRFVAESYDVIQDNFWDVLTDKELSNLYRIALLQVTSERQELSSSDRIGVEALFEQNLAKVDNKTEFTTQVVQIVLQSLEPQGRSALFTTSREKELRNTVANINPEVNLYDNLGLEKGASSEEVEEAYAEKKQELENIDTEEAREKLEKITYTRNVLSDEVQKETYDTTGAEPTVFAEELSNTVGYIRIQQLSPATFNEFIRSSDSLNNESLTSLILDLRGNIGGAVDILPHFLGLFIGPNQYAFEFFHQEEREPFKTQVGWLPSLQKYKKVVVLIDEATQSSAEIMAGTLKNYNKGVLVGTRTRGWGTIENTFPLETSLEGNTYSLFLVHSITLRPDGQPIEGRGIDPHISLSRDGWENKLREYFNDTQLIQQTASLIDQE